jgi:drug/metabolite transporter (DMT)-like permease
MMNKKIDVTATLALVGSVLCWATVPLFLKYFTTFIDGWVANGLRYPVVALLYLPWLIAFARKGQLTGRMWKLALLPAIINTIAQASWAWAPYYIDPGYLAFLIRLSTLWTVLGSFILFRDERKLVRSSEFWIGFSLALGGFVLLTLAGNPLSTRSTTIGIVLVLFTSIGWAGYQLAVRRNMQQIDSRAGFGMISVITSLGLIACMFTFGNTTRIVSLPPYVSILIVASGIIGIGMAHLLFYIAVKRIGVAIASSANLSSAFLTAILSRLIFKEILTPAQWVAGLVMIVGGILLTQAQVHVLRGKDSVD